MNEKIKQICDAIGALPDDRRTDVFLYAFTGGEVSQQIRIDHLKALASHALRVEKMLDAVDEIVEAHWNDGDVRAAVRRFEKVRASAAFEATQDDSNGRGTQD